MSALSDLIADSKGLPSASSKYDPINTVHMGRVVKVTVRQTRDDDGKPQFWEDGNPMQQLIIAIQTDQRDPARPGDDGVRGIYIKWWNEQRKAFIECMRIAGTDDVEPGGMFAVKYIGDGPQPTDRKLSPAKLLKFEYKPPTGMAGLLGGPQPPQPPQAPQQQAPQQGYPQAPAGWSNGAQPPVQQSDMFGNYTDPAPSIATPPGGDPWAVAPQPQPAPAPAPAAPVADSQQILPTIKMFITTGMTDAQIAAVPNLAAAGVTADAVAAIRSLPA